MKGWVLKPLIVGACVAVLVLPGCGGSKKSGPGDAITRTPRYGHSEIFNRRPSERSDEWMLIPSAGNFDPDLVIKPLDPFTVVLSRVYVPKPSRLDGKNIAVVLTVESGEGASQQTVVSYQTGLREGQPLNLQDLTVYSTPSWDGLTAPYFRIEVWDVLDPEDDEIARTLKGAEDAVRGLGGLFPSPFIPAIESVVRATRYILAEHRGNTCLVDHRVQFHRPSTGGGDAGGSATAVFQEGTWVLLGRPPSQAQNRRYFDVVKGMDRRFPIVFGADRQPLEIPTVVMTISREDQRVPSNVLNDAKTFAAALAGTRAKTEPGSLTDAIDGVAVSVDIYRAYRELVDGPSTAAFRRSVGWLLDTPNLSGSNERLLVSAIRRFTDKPFTTKSQVAEWWETAKTGRLDPGSQRWVTR